MMSAGDKLVVWKLDRLARIMNDLTNIVETIESKGASLEILDQRIDTGTASGKAFLQMLGVFAEFETNLRKERQLAGIAKAKQERPEAYQGRKVTTDGDEVKALIGRGLKPMEIARKLGVSRATVYRYK
jgi:DNA invertase Pin-like site-specific DNA recombinase